MVILTYTTRDVFGKSRPTTYTTYTTYSSIYISTVGPGGGGGGGPSAGANGAGNRGGEAGSVVTGYVFAVSGTTHLGHVPVNRSHKTK